MLKRLLLGLVIILAAIQLIRPAKNLAPVPGPNDITVRLSVPPDVQPLLHSACYDCHSNNTRYPWYAEVEPIGWLLASHVRDGKRHLNFSEFATYPRQRAVLKLENAIDEVTDHGMPLLSYRLIHGDARLSPAQIKLLTDWANAARRQLAPPAAKSPAP
jgi:hypothetical protein